jgi:hypothetical protein
VADYVKSTLLTNTRDAGNVIRRITTQRSKIRVPRWRNTDQSLNTSFVEDLRVADPALCVQNLDPRVTNQLEEITIASHEKCGHPLGHTSIG